MTIIIIKFTLLISSILILPYVTIGLIRKVKARMQNRVGARILQPLFDAVKMLKKSQTVSKTTTRIFLLGVSINTATILVIAWLVPWLSFKPGCPGDDLFLFLYMLGLLRFMTILGAMDSGSSFGAFGASREAFFAMLVEPAMFISIAALALVSHSSSLSVIFDLSRSCSLFDLPVWLAAAVALYLASVVDLSRMPVDDPNTHLELTMVHEAMILENSGKNLALVEFAHLLRLVILYGLITQCLLRAVTYFFPLTEIIAGTLSIVGILALAVTAALIESFSVKLQWIRTPEFIAYSMTMGLFAVAGALIGGLYARHGI